MVGRPIVEGQSAVNLGEIIANLYKAKNMAAPWSTTPKDAHNASTEEYAALAQKIIHKRLSAG